MALPNMHIKAKVSLYHQEVYLWFFVILLAVFEPFHMENKKLTSGSALYNVQQEEVCILNQTDFKIFS